jgi:dTDP-4-dehydrorhamnose reductase
VKALVAGAAGQVGRELQLTSPRELEVTALGRDELDITNAESVEVVIRNAAPDIVINAAAYTAVDRAESEEDLAFAVNATGASHLAATTRSLGARLVHLSTDYVFDGCRPRPWQPDDEPRPLSAYGRTKLAGEKAVLSIAGDRALIVRTSWIYSRYGSNFVKTMLDLLAARSELEVVCDQIGSPTWGRPLGRAIWDLALRPQARGILHWSDAGVASWYDFAVAIQETGIGLGLLDREIPISPISASEHPTAARRPAFSVLDTTATRELLGYHPLHWRRALRDMLTGAGNGARGIGA